MCRYPVLLLLLIFFACESHKDKISRLRSETLALLTAADSFEIKAKSRTFRLALPPTPERVAQAEKEIAAISAEAGSLHQESLDTEDQQRLLDLNNLLTALVHGGVCSAFDPTKCVVADLLKENCRGVNAETLLLKIPEYYAEVERRWQQPNKSRALTAARQSLLSLDMLDSMGSDAYPARLAVKDFIGMCQSAACAQ